VLECQAEIYEYLIGERESAPVEEYQECIDRINLEHSKIHRDKSVAANAPVFDPLPGRLLIERIDSLIERHN
jgi:hypothetical protein